MKYTNISMKYGMILLILILVMSPVYAQQTLGTFQLDSTVNLIQACDNSSYSNISRIVYPNSSFALNTQTSMSGSNNNYEYSYSGTDLIGQYLVYGNCDENGVQTEWVYNFWITYTGDNVDLSNTILVIAFLLLAGLFYLIGLSFNEEHWLMRTFFNFISVGMGLLAINSARIIASQSSTLGTMGSVGITIGIVVLLIFFLYIFVYYFIETIKIFKERRELRWNYD